MRSPLIPLRIRTLLIDPPLLLAPMAGLTHTAFRQIIANFGGCGLLSTEMLSAKRLPTENPGISPYLLKTASEQPLSYQLLTSTPDEIARAVEKMHRFKADAIDINMGCPAPSVGKFGAGSNLMDQPQVARSIVAEARKSTSLPLTAKIRLGGELNEAKLRDFCVMLQDEGIDVITVHARLKHEPFSREPRWSWIAKVKEWVTVPVIANGGIFSVADANACLAASGADGLMLGRGAVIRPWLFAEISRGLFGHNDEMPSVALPAVYTRFFHLLIMHFKPEHRLGRLKEFTHYFAKNYQFGHHLAMKVQTSQSVEEARERAERFFEQAEGETNFKGMYVVQQ